MIQRQQMKQWRTRLGQIFQITIRVVITQSKARTIIHRVSDSGKTRTGDEYNKSFKNISRARIIQRQLLLHRRRHPGNLVRQ